MAESAGCEFMDESANHKRSEAGLLRLNESERKEAFAWLLACCGSMRWAQMMVEARPFADLASLLTRADKIWRELRPDDWLEAFASHPQIGERQAAKASSELSTGWSEEEQSGARDASEEMSCALAEANRAYREKFGCIYIVCATGRSSRELLELCRERLKNDYEAELYIAAEEQRKITQLRLQKLIGATE